MPLEGTLTDMPMRDLSQVLRDMHQTGVLSLTTRNEHADIYIADGELRDAIVMFQGDQRVLAVGEAAVRYIARWGAASFVFRHDLAARDQPRRLGAGAHALLCKTTRIEANSRVVLGTPLRGDDSVRLSRLEWRVICQIGSGTTVADLAAQVAISAEYLNDVLDALLERELIKIVVAPSNRFTSRTPLTIPARVQSPVTEPDMHSVIQFVSSL
jgi:hypothetical protein